MRDRRRMRRAAQPAAGLVAGPDCPARWTRRLRCHPRAATLALVVALHGVPLRRSIAEDRVDVKTLVYREDGGRMTITSPSAYLERELSPALTLRMSAVYDMISGSSPTGAPPPPLQRSVTSYVLTPVAASPSLTAPGVTLGDDDEEEDEDEGEDHRVFRPKKLKLPGITRRSYLFKAGATPSSSPAPSSPSASSPSGGSTSTAVTRTETVPNPNGQVPKSDVEDERLAFMLELAGRVGRHSPAIQLAYSTEQDYNSIGLALRDAIDFNKKNTTLTLGIAGNIDRVEGAYLNAAEDKTTLDGMVGLTQLIDRNSYITANLVLGAASGYLSDPYKVSEVDGVIVPENRPDSKDKQILYLAWTRFFDAADGSLELGYRRYMDSFGIDANTLSAAWYQKLGPRFVLRPAVRFYNQTAADFYGVRFAGAPAHYSSDYRLSEFQAWGYGLKLIWQPSPKYAFDISVDRYVMEGTDTITSDDAYTGSTMIMLGFRLWL